MRGYDPELQASAALDVELVANKPNYGKMIANADSDEALLRIVRKMEKDGIQIPSQLQDIRDRMRKP
jgi:hypothetical protein